MTEKVEVTPNDIYVAAGDINFANDQTPPHPDALLFLSIR